MKEYTGKIDVSKDTMLFVLNDILNNNIKETTTKENILKMVPEIYEKTEEKELIKLLPYASYQALEDLIEYVKKSNNIEEFDNKYFDLKKYGAVHYLYEMMIMVMKVKGNERTYYVNGDVLEKLKKLFTDENRKIAERYGKIENLTMGMLYSYGVVDIEVVRKQLSIYMKEIISEKELDELYYERLNLNLNIKRIKINWKNTKVKQNFITYLEPEIVDIDEIIQEQEYRKFQYKIFKEKDILSRKEILWTPAAQRLYNYLKNTGVIGGEYMFEKIMKNNEIGRDVLSILMEICEFETSEETVKFISLFQEWYNNYPQYILGGYTPMEMAKGMIK